MKKALFFIAISISVLSFSQNDTLTDSKDSRLKVAGRVLKNTVLNIPSDFSAMGHTLSDDWKQTAYYTGGLVGLILTDKYTTSWIHDHFEPAVDYSLPNITFIENDLHWMSGNNAYITYPLVGLYAGSIAINNEKGQIVASNAFKSMAYCYLINHIVLKTVFARNRPQRRLNGNQPIKDPWTKDPYDFFNFHPVYLGTNADGTSFPSTHASAYYAVAKVMQMEYDNYWIPYTFATAVFFADFKTHNHWLSDLVAGALVGTVVGRSVVMNSRKKRNLGKNGLYNKYALINLQMEKQWIPQLSSNSVGLHFVGTF